MVLSTTHKEYILEKLHKEYLDEGTIPTSDQLEADLEEYQKLHPNLDEPLSKTTDFSVEHGDESSAGLIETIAETVSDDAAIITREIYSLLKQSLRFYDRWSYEMKRLDGFAKKLEQRVDSLLLLNDDALGFTAYVGDVFADTNKVDLTETDTIINTSENAVLMNPNATSAVDSSGGSLIDLSHMRENDIRFFVNTKRSRTSYAAKPNSPLLSMVKSNNSRWVGTVFSSSNGPMVTELILNCNKTEDLEVTKVSLEYPGPNATSKSTITCLYSTDGYNYALVPSSFATKALTSKVSWSFPLTSMRHVKFIIRKPAADNNKNEYIYSISNVKLFGHTFSTTAGNTFISKSLHATNNKNEVINFSMVSLDACEEIPTDTEIDYYIAASKDNLNWSTWSQVANSLRESGTKYLPKIVNFSGADWKNNLEESTTAVFNSSVTQDGYSQMKLTRDFDSGLSGYKFKSGDYAVVNTSIDISDDDDPDPVGESLVVWRNIRLKDTSSYPDTATVRDTIRGWNLDGGKYTCYFEILDSAGATFDFGSTSCVLDGQEVSGVTKVSAGVHKIVTSQDNWHDISTAYSALSSAPDTEDALAGIDPLYPYNHKLLIEGFPYGVVSDFKGEQVYTGTDISAEFYAKRVSLFELENNDLDNYGRFTVKGAMGSDTQTSLGVIVQFDPSRNNYSNELFKLEWRSGASDASMYKYVKLKAELSTEDEGVTPSITGYRIRLGT